jgi:hypothetical protein
MTYFDIGYFKKNKKINRRIKRSIKNKLAAWSLGYEYYDGDRKNGYGGFKYDGRWIKLLPKIIKKYNLSYKSKILDLGCKKGFIMKDFTCLLPKCEIWGVEDHQYPIKNAEKNIKSKIVFSNYYKVPFKDKYFDFTIAFSSIYKYNFGDLIKTVIEINRVSKKSLITVAAYSNDNEKKLFENWTLLGTTILHKKDWIKLFKLLKYKGDYYFTTAKSLGLVTKL